MGQAPIKVEPSAVRRALARKVGIRGTLALLLAAATGTGCSSSSGGGADGAGVGGSGGGSETHTGGGATAGAAGTCVESTCGSHKWPCWKMPNPPSVGLPNPASYVDLGNGAVRDNLTCLVWEKTPDTTQGLWQENYDHCAGLASSGFAGFSDWRLPTRVEMTSIVDFTRSPAVNATAFSGAPGGYHRTGSDWFETISGQSTANYAWIFNLGSGLTSNAYSKTDSTAVARCVRGNGSGEAQTVFAAEPADHYAVAGGEVTDNYTALAWQQGTSPAKMAWSEAAGYCAALGLNGHAWRVPSVNELATLVDEKQASPAINRSAFPDTPSGNARNTDASGETGRNWFWASHHYRDTTQSWGLNFEDGYTGYNGGAAGTASTNGAWNYWTTAWVKCVR
jgi:hypothetical protein